MLKFLARRIGFIILTIFGIVYLVHFGLLYARTVTFQRPWQDVTVQAWRLTLNFFWNLFHLNLGETTVGSILGNQGKATPIGDIVAQTFPRSLGLLLIALVAGSLIGVILGTITATSKRRGFGGFSWMASTVGISLPSFFLAVVLQIIAVNFFMTTHIRLVPVFGFGWDSHLILPAMVLMVRPVAYLARVSFVTLSDVKQQDFIRTAESKGLSDTRILWGHMFRNIAVPLLTAIGVSLRFSLSSLPVVEIFFGWEGMGTMLLRGVQRSDYTLVSVLVMILGLIFAVITLLLDMSYRLVDPRLRAAN